MRIDRIHGEEWSTPQSPKQRTYSGGSRGKRSRTHGREGKVNTDQEARLTRTQDQAVSRKQASKRRPPVDGPSLDVPAEAEPVGPRPRLPEPAVAPCRRRRRRGRGAAQHLPHHAHVLVLARAHLLPEPPQPCNQKSNQRRRSQPRTRWTDEGSLCSMWLNGELAAGGLTGLAHTEAGGDAEPRPSHRQHEALPPAAHRRRRAVVRYSDMHRRRQKTRPSEAPLLVSPLRTAGYDTGVSGPLLGARICTRGAGVEARARTHAPMLRFSRTLTFRTDAVVYGGAVVQATG